MCHDSSYSCPSKRLNRLPLFMSLSCQAPPSAPRSPAMPHKLSASQGALGRNGVAGVLYLMHAVAA